MGMPASRHGQKLMILTLLGWSADIPEGMSEWYETGETDSMALDLPASERLGLCKLAMMMATALCEPALMMLVVTTTGRQLLAMGDAVAALRHCDAARQMVHGDPYAEDPHFMLYEHFTVIRQADACCPPGLEADLSQRLEFPAMRSPVLHDGMRPVTPPLVVRILDADIAFARGQALMAMGRVEEAVASYAEGNEAINDDDDDEGVQSSSSSSSSITRTMIAGEVPEPIPDRMPYLALRQALALHASNAVAALEAAGGGGGGAAGGAGKKKKGIKRKGKKKKGKRR